jgi:hypothetical protein
MTKKKSAYRATVFIASSGESRIIADAVKANFDREADVDIWAENIFKLNQATLATLMNRASYYDFFIAVFAADDVAIIKKNKKDVTRDNVIFEFGLFLGRIGLDRTFFILEEGVNLFSDWDGITKTSYRRRDNLVAALGASCVRIKERMMVAEKLDKFAILPSTSLALGYYHNFLKPILQALENQKSIEIILEKDRSGNAVKKIEYELKKPYPVIEIRVPRNLAALERDTINRATSDLRQIIVKAVSRQFPFYIQGEFNENSNLRVFDIPTTLYASYLTIKAFFSPSFLAEENNEQKFMDKEIRNFEQTLSRLIPDNIEFKFYKFIVY